jgi:3-deoxy-D-manno-octulosonic-acid transferase
MEPIALGKPTIIGPCHADFADMVQAFQAEDGIIVTNEPMRVAAELLADRARAARLAENGQRVILSRQGATARHVEMLLGILGKGVGSRLQASGFRL